MATNNSREVSMYNTCSKQAASLSAVFVFACVGTQPVSADERMDLLLTLEQRLQQSGSDERKIAEVADVAFRSNVSVTTLIVMYAGLNLTRVAVETGQTHVTTDLDGKPLQFVNLEGKPIQSGERMKDGGASQIVVVLIAADAPQSKFRQEVNKIITQGERQAQISKILVQTVTNYSLKALFERVEAKRAKWPFPLCIPNCDEGM